ncbi:alpha/beta-hydrolase [Xylaria telfairii]|nr:alpha/beta-hydrolase [Xylaria telfairii]
MSDTPAQQPRQIVLDYKNKDFIAAPSYESFTARFGDAFPKPRFLESDLGITAVYEIPPPSGQPKRRVLMIHGLNTPALGLLPLAKQLQVVDPDTHVAVFDLWIYQVLGFMQWTSAHFLGYSFGGSILTKFVLHNPWAVLSATLLAPAGIVNKIYFGEHLVGLLDNPTGKEAEAMDGVLGFLEGGPLVVPADWQEKVKRGEIVAEAFREWELKEHRGYTHSVYSMFTEDNIYGCEDYFRKFAQLPLKKVTILGETDLVCEKGQLASLGFENVQVVPEQGHGLVRDATSEVAHIMYEMWTQ